MWIKRNFSTSLNFLQRSIKTSKERKEHYLKSNSFTNEPIPSKEPRFPKKKVALMLGFNGSNYQGMQINPGIKSIEEEVFKGLCKVGAVSSLNSVDPKKVQMMRAARTDKGVHACCNVISLKMICNESNVVEKLNKALPNDIRIWGYVETQRGFHAKNKCDSRIYEYLLPSYSLNQFRKDIVWSETPQTPKDVKIMTGGLTRYMTPTEPNILSAFRIDSNRFNQFKQAMSLFEGTHNFHNYTIARSFNDPASNRFMMNIKVEEPVIIQGMEWISVKLHGQSFMIHQIRKMISMALLCVRTGTPLSIIPKTFEKDKINIPKAPSLGLLLDRPVYDIYNKKIETIDNRQKLDFDLYKNEIEKFRHESVYSTIFNQELENNIFESFLILVDSHINIDYKYFNKEGIIPEESILTTKYSV